MTFLKELEDLPRTRRVTPVLSVVEGKES